MSKMYIPKPNPPLMPPMPTDWIPEVEPVIGDLKAPFPWFGGKSRVAPLVWERFGEVQNYVEPFFGSGAVLLGAPRINDIETVNDSDGFICNFWRAISQDPAEVANHANWPVNENDLHARHAYLVTAREDFTRRLEGDPDFYDAKIAGWWVWGICCWIGSGWCSGNGPWMVDEARQLVNLGSKGKGVSRKRIHLGNKGRGVNRQRVHLNRGQGVNRQLALYEWFQALRDRFRRVRVCCGDWERVCGPTPTVKMGLTAVFLDPPYSDGACRDPDLYAHDSGTVAHRVREWCIERGDDKRIRIALCGYEGEHEMPENWDCVEWKSHGGYGSESKKHDNPNARRERIWFSPHCLRVP